MHVTRDDRAKNRVLLHNECLFSPENGDFRQFAELAPPVRVYFKQLPFIDERPWLLSAVEKKKIGTFRLDYEYEIEYEYEF